MEIWKEVKGYENYFYVSNFGNIKRKKRNSSNGKNLNEKIYSPYKDKDGYLVFRPIINKRQIVLKIHRLVAITFISNPDKKKCVNHIDGNKTNNLLKNLEWCTNKENTNHAWSIGLNKKHRSKKVINKITNEVFDSIIDASKSINRSAFYLSKRLLGKTVNNTDMIYLKSKLN